MHSLKGPAAPPALAALSEPVPQHTPPTRSSFMDCRFLAGLFLPALMVAWPWKQVSVEVCSRGPLPHLLTPSPQTTQTKWLCTQAFIYCAGVSHTKSCAGHGGSVLPGG